MQPLPVFALSREGFATRLLHTWVSLLLGGGGKSRDIQISGVRDVTAALLRILQDPLLCGPRGGRAYCLVYNSILGAILCSLSCVGGTQPLSACSPVMPAFAIVACSLLVSLDLEQDALFQEPPCLLSHRAAPDRRLPRL